MFSVQVLIVVTLLFFNLHYYTTILRRVSTGVTPSNLGLKQSVIHRFGAILSLILIFEGFPQHYEGLRQRRFYPSILSATLGIL